MFLPSAWPASQTFNNDDGLSQSVIFDILQVLQGLMWF